jgi:hypothetical protein
MQRVNIWQGASCKETFYRGKSKTRPHYRGVSVILPLILSLTKQKTIAKAVSKLSILIK